MSVYDFHFSLADKNIGANHKVRALVYKINKEPLKSPWINGDMSELIKEMFPVRHFTDEQIREMVSELVVYFGKGENAEIFDLIKQK